jgi:hypothetical protein
LPPLETVSGRDLLSPLPEVNERAVAAASASAPASPAPAVAAGEPIKDTSGVVFRPGFHRVKADGSPFTGKRGQFMPRGGRKKGLAGEQGKLPFKAEAPAQTGSTVPEKFPGCEPTKAPDPAAPAVPATPVITPEVMAASDAAVESSLRTFYFVADSTFGGKGEWQPDDKEEHEGLKAAAIAWMRAGNIKPPPAWVTFLFSVFAYGFSRMGRANTARRLVGWFPWLGSILGVEPTEKKPEAKSETAPAPEPKPQPVRRVTDNAAEFFQ